MSAYTSQEFFRPIPRGEKGGKIPPPPHTSPKRKPPPAPTTTPTKNKKHNPKGVWHPSQGGKKEKRKENRPRGRKRRPGSPSIDKTDGQRGHFGRTTHPKKRRKERRPKQDPDLLDPYKKDLYSKKKKRGKGDSLKKEAEGKPGYFIERNISHPKGGKEGEKVGRKEKATGTICPVNWKGCSLEGKKKGGRKEGA